MTGLEMLTIVIFLEIAFYFCLFDCVLIVFAVWWDLCFSSSNVCVLMHDSQRQIEMLMKSMAHVAQQEVKCREITSAHVIVAAERDGVLWPIGTVARLWSGQSEVQFLLWTRDFALLQNSKHLRGPPSLIHIQRVPGVLSVGQSGQGLKVTAYLHLVPRLGTSGAMPVLPLCAFIMHTRTAFPLFYGLWKWDFLIFHGS